MTTEMLKKHDGTPGPRPLVWKSGPNPERHEQYIAWARAKAQANFRNERWQLSFEDWCELWEGQWHRRGRVKDTVCLTRRDYDEPWCRSNCEVISRREHNQRQKDYARR
jgi:hypothetical protein